MGQGLGYCFFALLAAVATAALLMLRWYCSKSVGLGVKLLVLATWTLNCSAPAVLVLDSFAFDRLAYFQDDCYENATVRENLQVFWRLLIWGDLLLFL